jgi:BON domain-containing protein
MFRPRGIGLAGLGTLFVLALGTTGCSRGPDSAQIVSEVQNRVRGDRRLQMARVQVRSTNGIVTLTGYVGSGGQRIAMVQDAAQIKGVRVVVDNLRMDNLGRGNLKVGNPGTGNVKTINPASQRPTAALQKPSAAVARPANRSKAPIVSRANSNFFPAASQPRSPGRSVQTTAARPSPAAPASVASEIPSIESKAAGGSATWSAPSPAADIPPPELVTVPYGTALEVRLTQTVSSDLNQKGDTFLASLASPIMIDDRVVIPADAAIQGKVVEAENAGRFNGKPALVIEVTRLAYNGRTYELRSNQYSKQGASRSGRAVATIGGGAGLGALIGGILGGGRGAAIGAMIGAGAGTGVQAAGKAPQVELPAESMLSFRLETPLTVEPSSSLQRTQSAGSDSAQDPFSSDDRPVLKRRPGSPPPDPDMDRDTPAASPPSDQNFPEESTPPPPGPN